MAQQNLKLVIDAEDNASKQIQGVSKSLKEAGGQARDFNQDAQKIGIAMVAVGAGLTAVSKNATDTTLEFARGVNKLSRETGVGSEQMSRLLFAFQRTGLGVDGASTALGVFSKKIAEANSKTGEAALKTA